MCPFVYAGIFSGCICLECTRTVYTTAHFLSTLIIHRKLICRVIKARRSGVSFAKKCLTDASSTHPSPHPSNAPQKMCIAAGEAGRDHAKRFYFTFVRVAFDTFPRGGRLLSAVRCCNGIAQYCRARRPRRAACQDAYPSSTHAKKLTAFAVSFFILYNVRIS